MTAITIEIFDRRTGNVVETIEGTTMRSFRAYWDAQCNRVDYGFRVKGSDAQPPQTRVRKEQVHPRWGLEVRDDAPVEVHDLTDDLLTEISKFNGALSPGEVHAALMQGKTIYTSFSRYSLENG